MVVTISLLMYAETKLSFCVSFWSLHWDIETFLWRTPWRSSQTFPEQSYLLKCQTLSQYTCRCSFIYTYKKVWPSQCQFSGNSIMCRSLNFTQIRVNMENINSLTSQSKALLSLWQFSQNSQSLGKFTWVYPVPICFHMGCKCRKYGQILIYTLNIKYDCHWTNFHQAHNSGLA